MIAQLADKIAMLPVAVHDLIQPPPQASPQAGREPDGGLDW
jgi:hypothetical protein